VHRVGRVGQAIFACHRRLPPDFQNGGSSNIRHDLLTMYRKALTRFNRKGAWMRFLTGDLRSTNAYFLLVVAPMMPRIWYEAVVWRLQHGPEMLGFQLMHRGGLLAAVVSISLFATSIYIYWCILVSILHLISKSRREIYRIQYCCIGAICVVLFAYIADSLQQSQLTHEAIYAGAGAMAALALVIGWLVFAGFRRGGRHSASKELSS
jgi:hypothetical protein